jgi:hypothetical protein
MPEEEKILADDGSNEPTYAITSDGQVIGIRTKRINGVERVWKLDDIIRLLDDGMRFRQMRKG